MVFGGTSVAAPVVAAVNAITGGGSAGMMFGSFPYMHTSDFFDVTSGGNGGCRGSDLCTGKVGYDGPTGVGTPNVAMLAPPPPPAPPSNTDVPLISGSAVVGE